MSATELITLITETRERLAKMEAMVAKMANKEAKKTAKKTAKGTICENHSSDTEIPYPPVPASQPSSPKAEKPKRAASAWAVALKEVYTPLVKEALGEGVKMNGLHMKVAGYLKKNDNEKPSLDDVKAAIAFLQSNPEYKSDTAQKRADTASEGSKKRGRPKKVRSDSE
uniref:Uncharacterized protein n=1 Tax=viral metagenome TaxID=1070528 RepID=A0A6C0D920_9ZZZZ